MAKALNEQIILAEWLFIETVEDLQQRSQDAPHRSRYELLGIAPLLRKLLVDSPSVLSAVLPARPRVPTIFRIRSWHPPTNHDNLPYLIRLSGSEIVGDSSVSGVSKVQSFLGMQIGQIEGEKLSVRQVIKYYANVEGGVHLGKPRELAEEPLSRMAPVLLGNTTSQIEILAHLGRIVADALEPLRQSILSEPMIIPPMHRRNSAGYYDLHWTAERHMRSRDGQ